MTIRVLLADDHELVREGLRALIEDDERFAVVAQAATGLEAIDLAQSVRPDVVLMDLSMVDMNGFEATSRIKASRPDSRIVVVSMHSDVETVRRAFHAGASGYVVKSSAPGELRLAIDTVMRGQIHVSASASRGLAQALMAGGGRSPLDTLTPRQREILQLLAEGLNTKAIAHRLSMSVKTAETHRSAIKERLGIRDLAGLVRFALEHRLIR